jgi:hypothetical protein
LGEYAFKRQRRRWMFFKYKNNEDARKLYPKCAGIVYACFIIGLVGASFFVNT